MEPKHVLGWEVVVDHSPVFRLVAFDDAEVFVLQQLRAARRAAFTLVEGAPFPNNVGGHAQTDAAIDAALTCVVVLVVGLLVYDVEAQEPRWLRGRMGDERLLGREFQFQCLLQVCVQLTLDTFGFSLTPDVSKEEVIRVADVPEAPEVGGRWGRPKVAVSSPCGGRELVRGLPFLPSTGRAP